ncbi:MAG: di-heme oxidoredictase family protein, partial [Planctomycetota bacterium]
MLIKCSQAAFFAGLFVCLLVDRVPGESPAAVEQGRELFDRQWSAVDPVLGRDGLGPLFNATSCSQCHQQGGIGGGGDSR